MASGSESGCKEFEDPLCCKDKMNQWIKDGVDLVSLVDQGDIRDVDDLKQYLACSGDSADIDKTNSAGQTPLMIACRNGQKDIVNFLLGAGANPNLNCTEIGNSALHYACQGDKDVVLMCRGNRYYPKEELREIIKIVELLVNHGAVPGVNADGFSPACVAALNSFKDVVAFFASSNFITTPTADKVKAYKLLGVSQAVFDKYHLIDACESFHLAASLHSKDDSDDTPDHVNSDLDAWFFYMMNKKNVSGSEEFEVKAKAVVIGLQCLPAKIKDEHNCTDVLAKCAVKDTLGDGKATEERYNMFVALVQKEMLEHMEMMKLVAEDRPGSLEKLQLIPKLLEVYAEGFRVDNCLPSEKRCEILELLGGLLFNLAYFQSDSKYLDQSLPFVGCIVACMKKIFDGETSQAADQPTLSISTVFFDTMVEIMWEDMYSGQSKKTRNRLQFAIFRILYFNGFDPNLDKSLLHSLLDVIPVARDMEFILSVSRVLILQYGCSTDDACLEEDVDEEDADRAELLELLRQPTTPISLEELASRAILCNRIPYRDRLPVMLCEQIEGELLNPDPSELDSSSDSDAD